VFAGLAQTAHVQRALALFVCSDARSHVGLGVGRRYGRPTKEKGDCAEGRGRPPHRPPGVILRHSGRAWRMPSASTVKGFAQDAGRIVGRVLEGARLDGAVTLDAEAVAVSGVGAARALPKGSGAVSAAALATADTGGGAEGSAACRAPSRGTAYAPAPPARNAPPMATQPSFRGRPAFVTVLDESEMLLNCDRS
jgi:hypothetical protein